MIFGSMWEAYDAGLLTPEKILLLAILYRQVKNPRNGYGSTSYEMLCTMMKRKPTELNINGINKLMADLKEQKFIWFPNHSGSKDFSYVIADFKLAKKPNETIQKWIDIEPYFQSQKQSGSRDKPPSNATIQPEAQPRSKPPEQRSERSNSGEFKSVGEVAEGRYGRPPQTNTDNQM